MKRDSRLSVALHTLLHMSEQQTPITSETLGENMQLNPVVIRRTMAGLRKAGLVKSTKGHGGGWSVARHLKAISLLDIYRALDEPILIQQHRSIENSGCLVEQTVNRALSETFRAAEDLIAKRFKRISMASLSEKFLDRLADHKHVRKNSSLRKA